MEDGTHCNMWCSFFVLSMWSVQSEFMVPFMVCNLWIKLGFIFFVFNSYFPVTTLALDLFSGAHLNKLLFLRYKEIENSST
jgi:hypothetical protein